MSEINSIGGGDGINPYESHKNADPASQASQQTDESLTESDPKKEQLQQHADALMEGTMSPAEFAQLIAHRPELQVLAITMIGETWWRKVLQHIEPDEDGRFDVLV